VDILAFLLAFPWAPTLPTPQGYIIIDVQVNSKEKYVNSWQLAKLVIQVRAPRNNLNT
jgi:hypothetical protein